jgi:hypothetical protein|tara:strand:+ start:419 stop:625 length:207 start_codon:yes stop_codon:yes gene_type:complete
MAEIWNPFDAKNPVYKQLAKKTAINNKTWRIVGSVAVVMIIADYAGKKGYKIPGLNGVKNNPYGIIRK